VLSSLCVPIAELGLELFQWEASIQSQSRLFLDFSEEGKQ